MFVLHVYQTNTVTETQTDKDRMEIASDQGVPMISLYIYVLTSIHNTSIKKMSVNICLLTHSYTALHHYTVKTILYKSKYRVQKMTIQNR